MKTATVSTDNTIVVNGIYEPKQNVFFRLSIISYELGDVSRDIKNNGYNLKLSLADAFTQLSILCKELDLDENKLLKRKYDSIGKITLLASIGDIHRDIVYMKRFPKERKHKTNLKMHNSILFSCLSTICILKSLNEYSIRELGWEHLRERYEEFKERNWVKI